MVSSSDFPENCTKAVDKQVLINYSILTNSGGNHIAFLSLKFSFFGGSIPFSPKVTPRT